MDTPDVPRKQRFAKSKYVKVRLACMEDPRVFVVPWEFRLAHEAHVEHYARAWFGWDPGDPRCRALSFKARMAPDSWGRGIGSDWAVGKEHVLAVARLKAGRTYTFRLESVHEDNMSWKILVQGAGVSNRFVATRISQDVRND